jgi:PmbA protein
MNTTESLNAGTQVLERLAALGLAEAKRLGADAAKIATGVSFQKRLVVENKQFSLVSSLESRSFALLVHKDQKKGSASINTVTEDGVRKAVADALALAQFSVPDPDLTLASRDEAPVAKPLDFLYDPSLAEMTLEEIQETMGTTLARLVKDPRVALDRFEMAVDVSWHGLSSSTGMHQTERQTISSWSFFGMARDGDEVTGFDYDGSFAFKKPDILARATDGADRFVEKILRGLNPVKCPSYKGAVLLSPRAVEELFLGMILYHAGGRQVMDGKSRWDKAVGTSVLSPLVTLADDPHDPIFSGATAFDSDGIPTKALSLIEHGVLKQHLHDCYSAKKCKARSTGTAGGPFSARIAAGSSSLASVLKSHDRLLLVDRFSGNSDPVKGEFSGVAKSSRLYEKGVDRGSVTETMIAGNFFELVKAVLAVTQEVEMVGGNFRSPYLLVDGISVTGGAAG